MAHNPNRRGFLVAELLYSLLLIIIFILITLQLFSSISSMHHDALITLKALSAQSLSDSDNNAIKSKSKTIFLIKDISNNQIVHALQIDTVALCTKGNHEEVIIFHA